MTNRNSNTYSIIDYLWLGLVLGAGGVNTTLDLFNIAASPIVRISVSGAVILATLLLIGQLLHRRASLSRKEFLYSVSVIVLSVGFSFWSLHYLFSMGNPSRPGLRFLARLLFAVAGGIWLYRWRQER